MLNAKYSDMGTKFGYFYLELSVGFIGFTLFFVPETWKLSISIDRSFVSGEPAWKTNLNKTKQIMASQNAAEG